MSKKKKKIFYLVSSNTSEICWILTVMKTLGASFPCSRSYVFKDSGNLGTVHEE